MAGDGKRLWISPRAVGQRCVSPPPVFAFRGVRAGNVFARHLLVSIFASVCKHVVDKKKKKCKILVICFCVIPSVIFIFIIVIDIQFTFRSNILHTSFRVLFYLCNDIAVLVPHVVPIISCERSRRAKIPHSYVSSGFMQNGTYNDCPISVRLYVVPVAVRRSIYDFRADYKILMVRIHTIHGRTITQV